MPLRFPFHEPPPRLRPGAHQAYPSNLADLEQHWRSSTSETRNWRLVAIGALSFATCCVAVSLFVASSPAVPAVYVVEVDRQTGEPLRHQIIDEPLGPKEAVISATMGRWIQMTRSKSIDPVVLRQQWEEAYRFVPDEAKRAIDAYATSIDPFNPETLGKEAITVEVESVTQLATGTWQVRWLETTYRDGQPDQDRTRWTANLGVEFLPPTTPRQIVANPLGLMITQIYVQPDYDGSRS